MESYKRAHESVEGATQQNKRAFATLCLLVSNEHAGAVIGPKGSTLSAIRYVFILMNIMKTIIITNYFIWSLKL